IIGWQQMPCLCDRPVLVSACQLTLDEGTEPALQQIQRLANALVIAHRHALLLVILEQPALFSARPITLAGKPRDLGPALDQAVAGDRLGGALLPLADGV